MTPAPVTSAGEVIVGENDREALDAPPPGSTSLASPKSSTFNTPSGAHLDVGRLEIAVDDAVLVCRFEGIGDLARQRQGLVDRHAAGCAVGVDQLLERRPSTNSSTSARAGACPAAAGACSRP